LRMFYERKRLFLLIKKPDGKAYDTKALSGW
jgi:hypothetical protein